MSSRFTVDTTYLKIRDVFAFNTNTGEVIPKDSVPVIGKQGHIDWKSSLEFISTLSIPVLSTTVLGILETIQPGLSTLSTVYFSTMTSFIRSTVAGLGSLPNGNDYISTTKLTRTAERLASDYCYISSTTLYECINRLGNLNTIGPLLRFPGTASNFDARGYVSTLNPGEYKIYQSSLSLQGANAVNTPMATNAIVTTGIIGVGGYTSHIVDSSKMKIDINTNLTITNATVAERTVSTFLTKNLQTAPVGNIVVMTYTGNSITIPNVSFLINSTDLSNATTLQLKHVTNSATTATLNTIIPTVGGIHVMLDNTD
jgi:hypothetical protein